MAFVLRLILAAVFVVAGLLKALDPVTFAKDIEHFRVVGPPVAAALALYLSWLEMVCGAALLLSFRGRGWSRASTLILLPVMLVFTVALLTAFFRGIDIRCGCFGKRLTMSLIWAIVRNALIVAGLVVILAVHSRENVAAPMIDGGQP